MRSSPFALMLAGAVTLVAGAIALGIEVGAYLANYRGIDSDAGLIVFRLEGQLVSYPPFEESVSLTIIGVGIAIIVGALLIGAITWKGRASGR